MKHLSILFCFLIVSVLCQAQQIKPLTVGDKMPDVVFKNVLYHSQTTARLSDFKGKLIILDFWSSTCLACIQLFPHMDSLQREFGSRLQIILVNGKSRMMKDDSVKITRIIERVKKNTGMNLQLPVVYDCTELDHYFQCQVIPHEVWIDGKGEIVGITSDREVNRENIQAILDGKEVRMRLKKDILEFDAQTPLFVNGNAGFADDFLYRSIMTSVKEGEIAGIGTRRNGDNEITGFYIFNKPLMALLATAYPNTIFLRNRVITDLDNSLLFPPNDESMYPYLFCYDLTIPPSDYKTMTDYVRQDVERYFQFSIHTEKRKTKCMVLSQGKGIEKSFSKVVNPESDLERSSLKKYVKGYSISDLVGALNGYTAIPVLNETGFDKKIDMSLPFDLSNKDALKAALRNAGFTVKEEERDIEMTVIGKRKN